VVVSAAIAGAAVGIGCTVLFSAWFMRYGEVAREVADATTIVTVLEKLDRSDLAGVESNLRMHLSTASLGLDADGDRLSASQKGQLRALRDRIGRLNSPTSLSAMPME
jgi:hypothetical protein